MPTPSGPGGEGPRPSTRASFRSWGWLLGLSALLTLVLLALRAPAATLLGPMVAAVVMAVRGEAVPVLRRSFVGAQATVGVMMASHLPVTMWHNVAQQWPALLTGTACSLLVSLALGWWLTRSRLLPGTTAVWGSTPGAATAMTLMSGHFGADMRLVAFTQYLRVLCCALVSAMVVHHFSAASGATPVPEPGPLRVDTALTALALAATGVLLNRYLRPAGGPLLPSLLLGMAVHLLGGPLFEVPPPLLLVCYAVLGWGIGGRFSRDVLRHAGRIFPIVLGSVLAMIGANALGAWVLIHALAIDPLTAFLATSPGGADSVAIISAGSAVDLPFVMTLQVMRFLAVVTLGPLWARAVSRRLSRPTG